eukprot:COSAG06_NODE_46379_length_347_cov_1.008065_1_plen_43_part_01
MPHTDDSPILCGHQYTQFGYFASQRTFCQSSLMNVHSKYEQWL